MKKVIKVLSKLDTFVAVISLVIIIVITLAGVIMRYIVGRPLAWIEEMQIFFFVYTIFFGGSVAFRTGNQVSIDLIANRLNPKAKKILDIFDYIVTMFILVYLMIGGFQLAASVSGKVTPYFKINYAYIDIAAPVGIILMIIQYTIIIVNTIKTPVLKKEGEDK